jgi:hypothetical protein
MTCIDRLSNSFNKDSMDSNMAEEHQNFPMLTKLKTQNIQKKIAFLMKYTLKEMLKYTLFLSYLIVLIII